jgi:DNA-directed RNA polymerase beta subunit
MADTGAAKFIARIQAANDDELIDFSDYKRRRQLVFDYAKEAVKQRFPLSNERYTLEVGDLTYDNPEPYTLEDQKKHILEGRSLVRPLRGRFLLKDANTGAVLEKGAKRTIVNVPYLTDRGTFIRNGNESVLINQIRMIPGIYHRKTQAGDYEAFFNVRPGTGTQFKMMFNPETTQFELKARGRTIPAYPVLRTMGITDEQLEKSWGRDILDKNRNINEDRALDSAEYAFVPQHIKDNKPEDSPQLAETGLDTELNAGELIQ